MQTWKIGSNWGYKGESVLDLFMDYGCVFFGGANDGKKKGNWYDVNEGDLFVIADGKTAVAVGVAISKFSDYETSQINFSEIDRKDFIDDYDVQICKAKLWLLSPEQRENEIRVDPQKRFCRQYQSLKEIESLIPQARAAEIKECFEIKSRTVSLINQNSANCIFSKNIRYRIPIYQRPYSWGENEIRRLFEDLKQALVGDEPIFMGTMQVSAPIPLKPDASIVAYDLIDGQQRISTLLLLLSVLGRKISNKTDFRANLRTLVNRGTAQQYLNYFWTCFDNPNINWEKVVAENPTNIYLSNALIIEKLLAEFFENDNTDAEYGKLWDFLNKNIRVVLIETHAGISKTIKIFNTINTAGLDLGASDLFKIRFYELRKMCGDADCIFDEISEFYAEIDRYNQQHPSMQLNIMSILATYQRILFARFYPLQYITAVTFDMAPERFFERLLDTALGIRIWDDFKNLQGLSAEKLGSLITLKDLQRIFECFKETRAYEGNNVDNKIIRHMLYETRYSMAWNFTEIARFFSDHTFDQYMFDLKLFKLVIIPSLRFAKIVNDWKIKLRDLLVEIANAESGGKAVNDVMDKIFTDEKSFIANEIENVCYQEIAWSPRWKNLLCKLTEYLYSKNRDQALLERLFFRPFDVEHIQCANDEDIANREQIKNKWGSSLHVIGNLVMLEQDINRSIGNKKEAKSSGYGRSSYISVRMLTEIVDTWNKTYADRRKTSICEQIKTFLAE